jgi:hypothetical protein
VQRLFDGADCHYSAQNYLHSGRSCITNTGQFATENQPGALQGLSQSGILFIPLFHPAAALHRKELQSTLQADILVLKELINREIREDEIITLAPPATRCEPSAREPSTREPSAKAESNSPKDEQRCHCFDAPL